MKERVKDHLALPIEVGIVVIERADDVGRSCSTSVAEKKLADPREHESDMEPSEITELGRVDATLFSPRPDEAVCYAKRGKVGNSSSKIVEIPQRLQFRQR